MRPPRPLLRRIAVAAVVAVTGSPAAPAVAASWSASETVGAPHTFVFLQRLAPGASALGAAWSWQDGIGGAATSGAAGALAPGGSGGAFGAERAAPAATLDAQPYARDRTLALTYRLARVAPPQTFRLGWATAGPTSPFGPTRTIVTAPVAFLPALAVNPGGRALVAYIERTAAGRRVRVCVREPGRAFGPPVTLFGPADLVTAAAGRRGDLAVVIARGNRLLARVRRPGHGWGSLRELRRARTATRWTTAVAITPGGRVVVAWRRRTLRTPTRAPTRALEATTMARAAGRFAPARTLDATGAGAPVLGSEGAVLAATHDDVAGDGARRFTPRAYLLQGGGAFGPPLDAGPARGGLRGVAVTSDPRAGTTVAWVQPLPGGDSDGQILGATLAPGAGAFGPLEAVSPAENAHEVRLAGDPRDGTPVAVWSARPGGTGPLVPVARIATVVRSARRER